MYDYYENYRGGMDYSQNYRELNFDKRYVPGKDDVDQCPETSFMQNLALDNDLPTNVKKDFAN